MDSLAGVFSTIVYQLNDPGDNGESGSNESSPFLPRFPVSEGLPGAEFEFPGNELLFGGGMDG